MNIISQSKGERLDLFLSKRLNLSRSRISSAIKEGRIKVDGRLTKPHHKTRIGEEISIELEDPEIKPEDIPLDIVYEDKDIIVVNKPPYQLTHPTSKIRKNTLVNALLFHSPEIVFCGSPDRPGIVHRLDKDTSGLILCAKTKESFVIVSRMVKERSVKRKYLALVLGRLASDSGEIIKPIGRPRKGGVLMKVYGRNPKPARTIYKVLERFSHSSLLEIELITGRTHQIRVHLASIGHPVMGDRAYGKSSPFIKRQALHAFSLEFPHPITKNPLFFKAPLPEDIKSAISALRTYG